jgi:hypothetical protein
MVETYKLLFKINENRDFLKNLAFMRVTEGASVTDELTNKQKVGLKTGFLSREKKTYISMYIQPPSRRTKSQLWKKK